MQSTTTALFACLTLLLAGASNVRADLIGVHVIEHLVDDELEALETETFAGLVLEAVVARSVALIRRQQDQGEMIAVHGATAYPAGGTAARSPLSSSAASCRV